MFIIENSEESLSEQDIKKFEKKFKISLPQDYKVFLLKYNGGTPEYSYFENKKRKRWNPLNIKKQYDTYMSEFYSLEYIMLRKKEHDSLEELPINLIQIAYDAGDSYICLSVGDKDKGCIYYGSSSEPHDYYENMYHLADSFTEFLNGLKPFEDS